jgi:hypothetical protein
LIEIDGLLFHFPQLKTVRERNAERLIKQGLRWERERLQLEEECRWRDIERRAKRETLLEKEKLYMVEGDQKGLDILRIKHKVCRDTNLRTLLMAQREKLGRIIQERDFDLPNEKDELPR